MNHVMTPDLHDSIRTFILNNLLQDTQRILMKLRQI